MTADIIIDWDFMAFIKYPEDGDTDTPKHKMFFMSQYDLDKIDESCGNFGCGARAGGSGTTKTVRVLHYALFGFCSETEQLYELVGSFPNPNDTRQPIRFRIENIESIEKGKTYEERYEERYGAY